MRNQLWFQQDDATAHTSHQIIIYNVRGVRWHQFAHKLPFISPSPLPPPLNILQPFWFQRSSKIHYFLLFQGFKILLLLKGTR